MLDDEEEGNGGESESGGDGAQCHVRLLRTIHSPLDQSRGHKQGL